MHFILNNMTLTNILAIIGSVTGSLSLIIQVCRYFNDKPKLRITTTLDKARFNIWAKSNSSSYILDNGGKIGNKSYFLILIQVTIDNKSSSPITVSNPISKNKNIIWRSTATYHLENYAYTDKDFLHRHSLPVDELFEFPLRIEPYDSVSGDILFYDSSTSAPSEFKLELNTPRKTFTKKITLHEIQAALRARPSNEKK